jgi:pimeloyl-ACP methyl ester carboxylesterase
MSDEVQTQDVQTSDGRRLRVQLAGDPEGVPVVLNAGTPNTRLLFDPWIEDARSKGIRLISYDRPGYGGSTRHEGHTVADGAGDVATILDELGIDRFAIWGFSGGGPYALATAALLPDRVLAAASVCSVAPWDAPGLDYFSGMGEDNLDEIKLYLKDPEASRAKGKADLAETLAVTPDQITEAWKTLLSDVDAAVLTGEFASYIVRGIHDGLAPGDDGWWDDGVAHLAPWGFAFEEIRVPVKVWHGRQDRFVPFQHGEWIAANVPGAEAALTDDDGHLTLLVDKFKDVHDFLLAHF